ncbi:MAG: hypothetical protein HYV14_10865 [Elusimicrobia bacterium]|nr:hypothetical protein [Elusimicrobiota bacterium]
MNDAACRMALGLLLLAACAPSAARAQFREEPDLAEISLSGETPESVILLWPTFSYRLARLMIAKYGQPSQATDHSLVWEGNGQWKRTVVYRVPPMQRTLTRGGGRLEQTVAYRVPARRIDDLGRFDKKIEADATEKRLTARSDDESENFLVLNLADEVLRGRRTPQEAADFRRSAARLRDSGKSSPYFDRLLFVAKEKPAKPGPLD